MIVVVGGTKGGSGKSTLATNLTVIRSMHNKKVLLIDTDEKQKSSTKWTYQRQALGHPKNWDTKHIASKTINEDIKSFSKQYDDIIIDAGGKDTASQRSALLVADALIMPFRPSSIDLWTLDEMEDLISKLVIKNQKIKVYAFIMGADSIGSDNDDTIGILKECPNIITIEMKIGYRRSFRNASGEGLGVIELKKKDKKAEEELLAVYNTIYS